MTRTKRRATGPAIGKRYNRTLAPFDARLGRNYATAVTLEPLEAARIIKLTELTRLSISGAVNLVVKNKADVDLPIKTLHLSRPAGPITYDPSSGSNWRITILLQPALAEWVLKRSEDLDMSVSGLLSTLIKAYVSDPDSTLPQTLNAMNHHGQMSLMEAS
jgi:hypothetical protein